MVAGSGTVLGVSRRVNMYPFGSWEPVGIHGAKSGMMMSKRNEAAIPCGTVPPLQSIAFELTPAILKGNETGGGRVAKPGPQFAGAGVN